ncbi:MAG: right-handed parallel beta-helix repeat-containing protein [Opitutaceae bacterium]
MTPRCTSFGVRWTAILAAAIVATLSSSVAVVRAGTAFDLVVSPDGRDDNPGTVEKPLRTMAAARDRLRVQLPRMDHDLVVALRGGDYFLEQPIRLDVADSGQNGFSVIYRNYPGEVPRIFGGRRITDWQRDKGSIYKSKLPAGWVFQSLICDGRVQAKARHPDSEYLLVDASNPDRTSRSQQEFHFRSEDLPVTWTYGPEAQVVIWSGYDWFTDTSPIAVIDWPHRLLTLAQAALNNIIVYPNRRYFIQGVREALDRPGEFFLDERAGVLYFWPPKEPIAACFILAPTVNRLIEICGRSPEEPVHHLRIEGLHLVGSDFGRRFDESDGTHGATAWNEPANLDAALYLEHTQDIAIRFCEISGAGYSGVSLIGSARRVEVYGNHIHDCGYHGVLLVGYSPRHGNPPPDVHRDNAVVNNHIDHCGRLVGHGAGIFIHSSGHNRIAHNLIHDLPRYGICTKGQYDCPPGVAWEEWSAKANLSRDNVYEFNHVHDVNLDSDDSGFISFICSGRHNVVRNNLLHDCPRQPGGLVMGIYLDDGAGYFTVENNLIYNLAAGEPAPHKLPVPIFAKGVHNTIQNNILIGGKAAMAAIWTTEMFDLRCEDHIWRRNIIWLENPDAVAWQSSVPAAERMTECDQNLFWKQGAPITVKMGDKILSLEEWRRFGGLNHDGRSIVADPRFVDAPRHDYRLQTDSPALKLGFQPFDISACGLLPDYPATVGD